MRTRTLIAVCFCVALCQQFCDAAKLKTKGRFLCGTSSIADAKVHLKASGCATECCSATATTNSQGRFSLESRCRSFLAYLPMLEVFYLCQGSVRPLIITLPQWYVCGDESNCKTFDLGTINLEARFNEYPYPPQYPNPYSPGGMYPTGYGGGMYPTGYGGGMYPGAYSGLYPDTVLLKKENGNDQD